MRSQIETANDVSDWNHKRRGKIYCFTEPGIAMLSSVLHSEQAIQMNISIMRTLDQRDKQINKLFQAVFERLEQIEVDLAPKLSPRCRKIGL